MKLDSFKKSWQEALIKPSMDEAKIQHMIDNKGQSAFNSLLRYERIMFIVGFICITIGLIGCLKPDFMFKDRFIAIFYTVSMIFGIIWQIYKYKNLKKTNLCTMSILEVSSKINQYKKFLSREIIVSIIWAIFIAGLIAIRVFYVDLASTSISSSEIVIKLTILILVFLTFIVGTTFIAYRVFIIRNINKIEKSIREIQEFEEDN